MSLITIDPVTFKTKGNCGGWALFERDKLVNCGSYRGGPENLPWQRADECVIETPVHYLGSSTPPQDLIDLAVDTGIVAGGCSDVIVKVTPNEWKGNTPKQVTERRVLTALSDDELKVFARGVEGLRKSWHHNVYDAVALGLWRLKRIKGR